MCIAGCTPTKVVRQFVIVYGDSGIGQHNLGSLPTMAANTHRDEVRASGFPGVPIYDAANDNISVSHVSTVTDLVNALGGNIIYLAYFGHSWNNGGTGALLIGGAAAPDTNLTDLPGTNNTPCSTLPRNKFMTGAQVRLFGCRGAWGTGSIAEQMHNHLQVTVLGYNNPGGALFTDDLVLGHGQRAVTQADINKTISASAKQVWLIPANGTPTFQAF